MSFPQYSQIDLNSIPLLNQVIEPIAGDLTASTTTKGRLYRNTSTDAIRYVATATTIVTIGIATGYVDADISATAAIALSKLATNPLARANHTGTQLASTISDFDTQVRTSKVTDLTAPTSDFSMNSHKITNQQDPTNPQDSATKNYVDNLMTSTVNGQDWKNSVRVAPITNITIASPGTTIDGVTMATNDRVLLAGQSTGSQNGIYVWNGSAVPMTRATDADTSAEVTAGMTVPVTEGTTNADKIAILTTNDAITLGTTALAFTFLAGATAYTAGTGLTLTGNAFSLTAPVTVALGGTNATTAAGARTNLGVPAAGYVQDIGALTAGVGTDITHNLGTLDVVVQVYRKSDGVTVSLATLRKDTNTVTVTSDINVLTGVLRIIIHPVV